MVALRPLGYAFYMDLQTCAVGTHRLPDPTRALRPLHVRPVTIAVTAVAVQQKVLAIYHQQLHLIICYRSVPSRNAAWWSNVVLSVEPVPQQLSVRYEQRPTVLLSSAR